MASGIIQDSERSIEEVYDKKTGNYIQSIDFFKQSEDVLMHWRRYLAEAALINEPRLVCSHCGQMVKLSGRKTERGQVVFFSHLYNSDDCDIKTKNEKFRKEILAEKYGKISESERHYRLKNLIADYLSSNKSKEAGITNVEIEKRINSNLPYLNYRRPDVSALYKDKNIVFELQLSTTFLDVVVVRDIFYRLNNYFIIWVFNFDENQEYVNLRNLMMKDIYYANKRNIFVFDEDAQYLSEENDCLYLHCMWMQADGTFSDGKFVTLEDLSFDDETIKPFYLDADEIFYRLYPERKGKIEEIERSREALMRQIVENQDAEEREKQRILDLENRMKISGEEAFIYSSFGEFGFKCNEGIITSARFDEVIPADNLGYVVRKSDNFGFVNKYGRIIISCQYKAIKPLFFNSTLVLDKNKWILFEWSQDVANNRKLDEIEIKQVNENVKLFIIHDLRKKPEADHKFLFFKNSSFIEIGELKFENSIWKFSLPRYSRFYEITPSGLVIEERKNDKIIAKTVDGLYGLLNDSFEVLTSFSYSYMEFQGSDNLKVSLKGKYGYGIIDYNEEIIFDIKYCDIGQLGENTFKVKDGAYWNVVDKDGNLYFSTQQNNLITQIGNFIVFENYNKNTGIINLSGEIKIEPIYSQIKLWEENHNFIQTFQYWPNSSFGDRNRYGFLSLDLKEVFRCDFRDIKVLNNGYITAKDYEHVYILNKNLEILFKAQGDCIEDFTDNHVIVKTYGKSYYDKSFIYVYKFNPLAELKCPEKFSSIGDFVDNVANVKIFREDKKIVSAQIDADFKPILCDVIRLSNGYLKGTKFGRWGVLDQNGKVVIPFKYADIIEERNGTFVVKSCDPNYYNRSVIDFNGHIIPDDKTQLDNGLYKIKFLGKCGVWDDQDVEIIPIQYNEIEWITEDLYKVQNSPYSPYSLIDSNNKSLLDCNYSSISLMDNGYIKFANWDKNTKVCNSLNMGGFMSPDSKIIVYGHFEGTDFTNHRLLMKRSHGESWVSDQGMIESDEEIALANGLIKFRQFGLYGLMDKDANILLACNYSSLIYCEDLGIYVTNEDSSKANGLIKIWDKNFSVIKEYQNVEKILTYIGHGLFIIENIQGKKGVINTDWKRIVSCEYNDIEVRGNYIVVSKMEDVGGRWTYREIKLYGIYTFEGLCIAYCQYRKVEPVGDRFWRVWYKDNTEILTFRGTMLRADKIWVLNDQFYKIERSGKNGIIDKDINTIVPVKYDDVKLDNDKLLALDGQKWIDLDTQEVVDEIKVFVEGVTYKGTITNFQKYGFFVKVVGIGSGLVHITEIKGHFKNLKDFKKGQEIEVKVKSFKDGKPNFVLCD